MTGKILISMLLAGGLLLAANQKVTEAKAKVKEGKFEEAITILDAAHKANAKDAEVKAALAETHLKYGDFFMYNEQLPPMRKYPSALKQYRAVLTYDAANKDAKQKIATIEGIYKSMGRPIPQ